MTIKEVLDFIKGSEGRIFTIQFIKRTDGSLREMTCRTGVKKHLVNNPDRPGLDFKSHNLIPVFDMVAGGYRSIPIEGIQKIKVGGEWEIVDHDRGRGLQSNTG